VKSHDGGWLPAKVVQKHHRLDEETRTIGIRLEVDNKEDLLHPGTFVDTRINAGLAHQHIAVPTAAILKSSDGDWIVFVEKDAGHFKPQEVEVVRSAGELSIITGLEQGTPIVVEGAFFVQSELLKSGFEVHDH
jgi:cobalt-zinc-cadmium efflux system membrane fusion protein